MLVLSRKEEERVCFPALGITVQINKINGSSVRLGVDAPMEIRIVRGELHDEEAEGPLPQAQVIRLPRSLRHEFRNELNALSLALHLFKQEVEAGHHQDAEATFQKLVDRVQHLGANAALASPREAKQIAKPSSALLVEDQPNEREMLAGLLRMHGYRVATAVDGLEAIEYLKSNVHPNVILIDMRMPRCDGPTTIRTIRENPDFDGINIFAMSGSTPEENFLDTKQAGVDAWFMKPLNPKSLVEAIASADRTLQTTVA